MTAVGCNADFATGFASDSASEFASFAALASGLA